MMVVDKGKCTAIGKTIDELNVKFRPNNDISKNDFNELINALIQEAFESGTVLEKESNYKKLIEEQNTTNFLLMEIQTLLRDRLP